MDPPVDHGDPQLSALPLPMKNVGIAHDVTIEHLPHASDRVFGSRRVEGELRSGSRTQFSVIEAGAMACAVGRTSPVISVQHQQNWATFVLCCAGHPIYREERLHLRLQPGSLLAMPNRGGAFQSGYCAGVFFRVSRPELLRTIRAMHGVEVEALLAQPCVWEAGGVGGAGRLFRLFACIDRLLATDPSLPAALDFDDQIHRLLASLVLSHGKPPSVIGRGPDHAGSDRGRLDDLVSYIRAQPGRALTLTDLQERSHYSARRLQTLFRQAFDCTPMQFVRRQRLAVAMEKLQTAQPGDTVTRIARECGYRHLPNFTSDFRREFGVNPSLVLRGAGRAPG